MINIANLKPGQRVTVHYVSPVTWARKTGNRFVDMEVSKEVTMAFSACGKDTYTRMMESRGQEKSGRKSWFEFRPALGPCVLVHPDKGSVYVAGINHDCKSSRLFIGGREATVEECEEMRSFMREREERERGLDFQVWSLDKLENATLE